MRATALVLVSISVLVGMVSQANASTVRAIRCDITSDGSGKHRSVEFDLDDSSYQPNAAHPAINSLVKTEDSSPVLVTLIEKCNAPTGPKFQYCSLQWVDANLFGGKASVSVFGFNKMAEPPNFNQMVVEPIDQKVESAVGSCVPGTLD